MIFVSLYQVISVRCAESVMQPLMLIVVHQIPWIPKLRLLSEVFQKGEFVWFKLI